ncbi:tetratricopeptide repeat protein [Treponema sp. OMZ 857]|uniref:tetratricopeptide repeat protein n=1 Tax=Treponema sp. OMZ 857 TaxID=1643513 RepID=UPI0020A27202|nr:tetratricopeptide repeat protein [Treponema sp. OMZ 857]
MVDYIETPTMGDILNEGFLMTDILNFSDFQFESEQNNEQKAQDIVYDAWDSESSVQRKRLAQKALELDPNCADAYCILAGEYRSYKKKNEYYKKGIEVFRKKYGEKYFSENSGYFWGILETRSFMRLSAGYGQLLWDNEKKDEAIQIYEELLQLNPNDNQGLRYTLINWLIDQNQLDKGTELLKQYQEETAFMLFSDLLLSIKKQESDTKILKKYIKAKKGNPYIVKYLLHESELPEYLPDYYEFGDEDEAVTYCFGSMDVWIKDQDTIRKLKEIRDK